MNEYSWNTKDINDKMKYLKTRLVNTTDPYERKKLIWSILTYNEMLEMIGNIRYTGLYNALDKITRGKYSLQKSEKLQSAMGELEFDNNGKINENYLQFLLSLAENVSSVYIKKDRLEQTNLTPGQVVELTKRYYSSLDTELFNKANHILYKDKKCVNFAKISRTGTETIYGKNYIDPIFNETYCSILQTNTLADPINLAHEVMHGIDNTYKSWLPFEEHHGFIEIPTMTNDMLMADYMESLGYNISDISILKTESLETAKVSAFQSLFSIKKRLRQKNKTYDKEAIKDIMDGLTQEEVNGLLFVESYVIAHGLAQQVRENKEIGLFNLKLLMSTRLSKHEIPNFSFIGLANDTLLKISQEIRQGLSYNEENTKRR